MCLTVTTPLWAQSKKALDHDVYEIWNRINEQAISDNGNWVLLSIGPENEDAELRIKSLTSDQSYEIPRGVSANFSKDARFAAFLIEPPKEAVRQAKLDEKKKDEQPKDSLGIINLDTGDFTKIERVKSYKLPEDGSGWIAYLLEKPLASDSTDAEPDSTTATEAAPSGEEEQEDDDKDKKKKDKDEGTPLVLRNLATGEENYFDDVTAYHFSKDGKWLVYAASNKEGDADGLFAVATASGTTTPILAGEGEYAQIATDEASTQVAFLSNRDDWEADQPAFSLYHWEVGTDAPTALATEGTAGIPDGWWVGKNGSVQFSKNGERLFFGTTPRPEPEEEDEDELEEEKVVVDIWSWTDPLLYPMQKQQADAEKKRTYRAVVHLADGRVIQLANEDMPEVSVGSEGNADVAISNSNMPYRQEISWDSPRYHDVYLIDVATGERRQVLERVQSQAQLSPNAEYLTWWDRDELAWYGMPVEGGDAINLTSLVPHPVHNEKHDWPYKPNPYGNAGWTQNDDAFLVYDKHDLWAIDPTGAQAPRSITEGLGRRENLRFRYVKLDPEEQAIDPASTLLLSAFQLENKASGFYRDQISGGRQPVQLVMEDRRFSAPRKAKDADQLLFTRESFVEFPNLWVSEMDLSDKRQVSDVNPQQGEYLWGSVELVEWASVDGNRLQGMLYKPENFDASKKYPMMVYFYEKNSDNLHRHSAPAPHRSIINVTFYASRGYLVFVPDIPYKTGYPGESAMNAVMPGVTALMTQDFVDEDNIGVQGHSWGGYQIAYMVTQTNLFKAAEAGAPVANMISAYGGIRWGTGMSRMFQYEKTQSRIGGTLWEYPMRYIHNSPIFQADKIETPLLIMHNDEDGAVPWYQGIELFTALRRLGKPVWLINYNGEPHWPTKYQNKKDWTMRMQQFFDHYLQGAPAPMWLQEGVPAVKKGKTLGLEPATPASSQ